MPVNIGTKLTAGSNLYDAKICDLSLTGCSVESTASLEMGRIVYVEVGAPGLLHMRLQGTVTEQAPGAVIVRFKELSATEVMLLDRLMNHLTASNPRREAPTARTREETGGAEAAANPQALNPRAVEPSTPVVTDAAASLSNNTAAERGEAKEARMPFTSHAQQMSDPPAPGHSDAPGNDVNAIEPWRPAEPTRLPEVGDGTVIPSPNNKIEGRTPLMIAASEGKGARVQAMLIQGADPNAADECGDTPLMMAALSGHETVVRILLSNGADVNAMTRNGWTALMAASARGHRGVKDLLKEAGAKD